MLGETSIRIAFVVSANLLMLIFVIIVTKIRSRNDVLPWYSFVLLCMLNLMCFVAVELLFIMGIAGNKGTHYLSVCLCLFGISILSIILYEVQCEIAERQKQYKVENEKLKLSQKHSNEIQSIYSNILLFRHDLKHQMQLISQVVANHDIGKVRGYIDDLNDKLKQIYPFATGNIMVDALLTAKLSIMRNKGVHFTFRRYPINDLPIGENDFCALIGNILDNAIEGVERLRGDEERNVLLSFARSWDMFYIICENPCEPETIRHINGRLASSKQGEELGLGTFSIEKTARKGRGHAKFAINRSVFRVEVVLVYEQETRGEMIL